MLQNIMVAKVFQTKECRIWRWIGGDRKVEQVFAEVLADVECSAQGMLCFLQCNVLAVVR